MKRLLATTVALCVLAVPAAVHGRGARASTRGRSG